MKNLKIVDTSNSNDGKTTNYYIEAVFDINGFYNKDFPNLYKILKINDSWNSFINKLTESKYITINNNQIIIKAYGKSVCHDDDPFIKETGISIARSRALKKLYKTIYCISKFIHKLILEYTYPIWSSIQYQIKQMHKIENSMEKQCNKYYINYWDGDELAN